MGRGSTRYSPSERRGAEDVRRVAGARERAAAGRLPAAARPLAQAPLPLLELGHALDRAGRVPPQTDARARRPTRRPARRHDLVHPQHQR